MNKLYALDESGKPVLVEYLDELLKAVYPAFKERADEIILTSEFGVPEPSATLEYRKAGKGFPLISPPRLLSIAGRIKILSKVSIEHVDGKHTGQMWVQFGERKLPVVVRLTVAGSSETMQLRPDWNAEHLV